VFQLFALVLRNADKSTVRPFIPCSARHFCKGAKFAGSALARVPPQPLTPSAAYDPRASNHPTYFDKFTPMHLDTITKSVTS